ncbi:RcnB family protein [Xenophilus sp.]|jgi:Ni/Co efflux regulator RcnB|uniref:RcnB family protein n=1 Tax=Xenophilus sp. TaxID=1873499 RepID=UPI0037DC70A9
MKRMLPALLVSALLVAPATALAQPQGKHKHGHKHHGPPAAAWQHDYRHDRRDHRRHDNGRHLGWYKQQWRRGQRVPVVYLQPRYVIRDYRAYRLAPPPAGYGWVRPYQDRNEYLMVQLATGLIAQVLGY